MQARFEPCTSKIQDIWLTTRTTIIYFKYYVFPFHIQIIEETTIENRVHKTMVLSPWIVHVISKTVCTKTMASNPWFCACHKHEKSYKNPSRACVKGGAQYVISPSPLWSIYYSSLSSYLSCLKCTIFSFSSATMFLQILNWHLPLFGNFATSSPVQDPSGHSSSTRTRESSRQRWMLTWKTQTREKPRDPTDSELSTRRWEVQWQRWR